MLRLHAAGIRRAAAWLTSENRLAPHVHYTVPPAPHLLLQDHDPSPPALPHLPCRRQHAAVDQRDHLGLNRGPAAAYRLHMRPLPLHELLHELLPARRRQRRREPCRRLPGCCPVCELHGSTEHGCCVDACAMA